MFKELKNYGGHDDIQLPNEKLSKLAQVIQAVANSLEP